MGQPLTPKHCADGLFRREIGAFLAALTGFLGPAHLALAGMSSKRLC